MSGLTKDQLKNELITHGVELPPAAARKEEYVRLYEKYVAPVEEAKGDFSSDDDEAPIVPVANKVNMEQSLIVDGLDVSKLDDDELYSRLSEFGATVGPIVDSTRKVYQKKLVVLMGGDVVDSPTYNGDVDEEEYSDSEEADDDKVEEEVRIEHREIKTSPPVSEVSDIRKRVLLSSGGESPVGDIYDPDRHTPSPRRSLRSVTSTTTTHETVITRNFNNGRSGMINSTIRETNVEEEEDEEQEQDRKSKISLIVRLLVKLLFLGLIIALILYIYQNDPNESPFKAVEQLARQALEAAVGEEAGVEEQGTVESVKTLDSPPVPPPPPQEEVGTR